jgi:hypothetical protein
MSMSNVHKAVSHISQTINRQMLTPPASPFQPEPISAILDRLNAHISANAARTAAMRTASF